MVSPKHIARPSPSSRRGRRPLPPTISWRSTEMPPTPRCTRLTTATTSKSATWPLCSTAPKSSSPWAMTGPSASPPARLIPATVRLIQGGSPPAAMAVEEEGDYRPQHPWHQQGEGVHPERGGGRNSGGVPDVRPQGRQREPHQLREAAGCVPRRKFRPWPAPPRP